MKTRTEKRGPVLLKAGLVPLKAGFTLIELLVVIAILGILMAMMVPAAGLILRRAKISTAKGDAGVIGTVMLKYQAEYNRWPGFYKQEDRHFTDKVWVDAMSPQPGGPMPPSNPKRIMLFEPSGGALAPVGDPNVGAFVDPWGMPFEYQVDLDGDGQCAHPNEESETALIPGRVIVWSAGPDKDYATWEDNVTSWE